MADDPQAPRPQRLLDRRREHGGSFEAAVDAAAGSAAALAGLLASWGSFADVSIYMERRVPFFKRAQLAAPDVDRAGLASFPDCHASPPEIDAALWNRGREPRYKALPRPRSRNIAY